MATISIRFPGGRYHATPWGSHVNEGVVEWPPSPWRLLRAFISVGFTKLGWAEVPDEARKLLGALSSVVPSYRLPAGEVAQTRHYVPIAEGRGMTTTRIIDAFLRLSPSDELLVRFPVDLAPAQMGLLAEIVSGLAYVGRSESWTDARVIADAAPGAGWCSPIEQSDAGVEPAGDQVALLAPMSEGTYLDWRVAALSRALTNAENEKAKPLTRAQGGAVEAAYPRDLIDCLMMETGGLQRLGWSEPPGSRWVLYARPPGTLEGGSAGPPYRAHAPEPVGAALLALSPDRATRGVLPLFSRCLPQAELLHESLISCLGEDAPRCPALSGRNTATGDALRLSHAHAHYLPLDLDDDGRLDHVLVHSGMGLDGLAQRALQTLRFTWTKGTGQRIIVTCAGLGDLRDFVTQLRTRSGSAVAALGSSRSWASITPFVPPRHLRAGGHALEEQVVAELRSRGLPETVEVTTMGRDELVQRGLLRFVRLRRDGKPQPPVARVFGLRLRFDRPVRGPLALGYASHYGLGLFAALPE